MSKSKNYVIKSRDGGFYRNMGKGLTERFEDAERFSLEQALPFADPPYSTIHHISEFEFAKKTLRAANESRQVEWDAGNQLSAAHRGNELAGEVGEACNVIKKLERERLGIRGSRDTVDHLAQELADVIICADLIAMQYGIDLEAAVARKFNATSEKVGLNTRLVQS